MRIFYSPPFSCNYPFTPIYPSPSSLWKILVKDWQFLEEDQMVFYHRRPISLHCFISNRIFFICSIFPPCYRKSLKKEKRMQCICQAFRSFSPSFLLWQVYRFHLRYSWWCGKFMKDTAEIKTGGNETRGILNCIFTAICKSSIFEQRVKVFLLCTIDEVVFHYKGLFYIQKFMRVCCINFIIYELIFEYQKRNILITRNLF